MPRERVLITVKTYPTLSRKYGETVCTAGVRPDGTWMRIYPVPFRRLEDAEQYRKYDWIEADFAMSRSDPRPETYHPQDYDQLVPAGHMDTSDNWRERRELLLKRATVYDRLEPLMVGAKENRLSLAVFKPTKILDFIWEDDDREWNADKVARMREQTKQKEMFAEEAWRETFNLIPNFPTHSPTGSRTPTDTKARCRSSIGNAASSTGIAFGAQEETKTSPFRKSAPSTSTSSRPPPCTSSSGPRSSTTASPPIPGSSSASSLHRINLRSFSMLPAYSHRRGLNCSVLI